METAFAMETPRADVVIPAAVPGIGYTLRHRKTVELLIGYYCERAVGKPDGSGVVFTERDLEIMLNRARRHDMDKVLMMLNYPQLTADYFHRLFSDHHKESAVGIPEKTRYDWIEMIMDWESAPYTKPDKGMNAYEVLMTFNQPLIPYCAPYMELFGLNSPGRTVIPEIAAAVPEVVTEADLCGAIMTYIHTTRVHLLENLSRLDDKGYMTAFGEPVPCRHPAIRDTEGLFHSRPNDTAAEWTDVKRLEMINGVIEAAMFDFDKLGALSEEDIPVIEARAKERLMTLNSTMAEDGRPLQR